MYIAKGLIDMVDDYAHAATHHPADSLASTANINRGDYGYV
jgi:hypothetical protein